MGFGRIIAISLLVLGFAVSANASDQLFAGKLIVHMRGSDAAGDFIGVPFGRNCNLHPYHAAEVRSFESGTLTIPKFGGQVPVIDTDSDGFPDVALGCEPGQRHAGRPLTGIDFLATTGTPSTTRNGSNPRAITLPKSKLERVTTGASFPPTTWVPLPYGTYPFDFEIEYADLRNGSGAFSDVGGPSSFTVSRSLSGVAKIRVKAGANQFGGTMRLLGEYRTNRGVLRASTSVGATPWNLQYIGAGAKTMTGKVTAGLTYKTRIDRTYHYRNKNKFGYSPRYVTASVFPWTTGTVEVTALSGPQETVLKRTGYDNRTPMGSGAIQMVSPALTRWRNPLFDDPPFVGDYHTGSIGVMKIVFIPEPEAGLMVVAGIFALVFLYRANGRRGRAR
jgi:hypothetical protein